MQAPFLKNVFVYHCVHNLIDTVQWFKSYVLKMLSVQEYCLHHASPLVGSLRNMHNFDSLLNNFLDLVFLCRHANLAFINYDLFIGIFDAIRLLSSNVYRRICLIFLLDRQQIFFSQRDLL